MSLSEKREKLIEDFSCLPDAEERLRHLMFMGRNYPPLEPAYRTDDRLLPGCVSRLWFVPELRDGLCYFHMDADAQISKGIGALMCGFYSGESPVDIVSSEPDFLKDLGIASMISSNRSNALANLRRYIKAFAESCLAVN